MKRQRAREFFAATAVLALTACAQNSQSSPLQVGQFIGGGTRQMPMTGAPAGNFLPDPSLLQPGGEGRADLLYVNPQSDPASFRQVILEPSPCWPMRDRISASCLRRGSRRSRTRSTRSSTRTCPPIAA